MAPQTSRVINLIVIHCSASPNGDSLFRGRVGEPGFQTPADVIDGWHRARGFHREARVAATINPRTPHIGYHFVVACNGALFTGRGVGEVGAHAAGFNARSIGVCLTGTDAYTAKQWAKLADLVRALSKEHGVPIQPAQHKLDGSVVGGLCGHRDLSPDQNRNGIVEPFEWLKTCPGFDVGAWIENGLTPTPAQLCEEQKKDAPESPGGASKTG